MTFEQTQARMHWHQEAWKFLRAGLPEPVEPVAVEDDHETEAEVGRRIAERDDGDDQG